MSARWRVACLIVILGAIVTPAVRAEALPKVAPGWRIELIKQAPEILFPTAAVVAPDGTIYLGQDPMDMPGPPTVPTDSVVAIKDGKVRVFADKLWAVMGLEWADDTLFVVHAPYLSAFRDSDGDGAADQRVDLMTGLGPKLPGFSGINDHVASGVRLGIDGFLYISVGDKGIPKGVGKDGTTIQLFGGGVIRIRPDGTGLEVVSTGERNPLSVMLSARDDVFTYGNDDDSKQWPNSITHHIVGGHYGYPYQFLNAPFRALPVMHGQIGGSGTQGICYNEDAFPAEFHGNLFFCDWGLQTVFRVSLEPRGASFAVKTKTPLVEKGDVGDFRPFSLAVGDRGASLYLVDWAFNNWLADGPKTGRLYRLTPEGARPTERPPWKDVAALLQGLEHPALSVRLDAQRTLSRIGAKDPTVRTALEARLSQTGSPTGRIHALWALDAIGSTSATAIRQAAVDADATVRVQSARRMGIRRDAEGRDVLVRLLKDREPTVRREAAIALGSIRDASAAPALMAALGEKDPFVAWSIRTALRKIGAWDTEALIRALSDPRRREDALKLCDEVWAAPVVEALTRSVQTAEPAEFRARVVTALAGLYRKYPEWSGNWFGTNPLAGQFPQKTVVWDKAAMERVQQGLSLALKDAHPEVRLPAIAGLILVGRPAVASLRGALATEQDQNNLTILAQGLGVLGDFMAAAPLGALAQDGSKPESVRAAALDALGSLKGPQALTARFTLVYDPNAPASLVARALPSLGREDFLPPNDLSGFLENASPLVRAAALRGFKEGKGKPLPDEVRVAILKRLTDADALVRRAAIETSARLQIRESIPLLVTLARQEATREDALLALAAMPDTRAAAFYLEALRDKNPGVRRASEAALLAIRDSVREELATAAKSGQYEGPSAVSLERVMTRFAPVVDWRVIGPFARTTAQVFVGEPTIDFEKTHSGANGFTIAWAARKADPKSGRVVIDDFKAGAGDRGGFGYDTNGSPDLCGFGYAEITADHERDALLLVGSSGSITITVNERVVHNYQNFAGRAFAPDSDLVRVRLAQGVNRILVKTRQGIGAWSFSVQVSDPSATLLVGAGKTAGLETLRAFALNHAGDPRRGEELFFDPRGIGCVKCHAAGGRGTANIGPDLTGLALKYDKAEMIRSVLEPSNRLATGYQPTIVATQDGRILTGLIRAETEAYLDLVDVDARITRINKSEIEERKIGDVSVMPAGLAETLGAAEFADLISYLGTLKTAPVKTGP